MPQVHKEPLVRSVQQVPRVARVLQELPDHRGYKEMLGLQVLLDLPARKEFREMQVPLVPPDLPARREHKEM